MKSQNVNGPSAVALIILVTVACGAGCAKDAGPPLTPEASTEMLAMSVGAPEVREQGGVRKVIFPVTFSGEKTERVVELTMSDVEFGSAIMAGDVRLFEMHWNVDGSGWEQTPAERLDILRQPDSREMYRFTNRLSGTVTELLDDGGATAEEWFSFFAPVTLNGNIEGDRLAEVLTSRYTADRLQPACAPEGVGGIDSKRLSTTARVCAVAGTLGRLKCAFGGGVANALCHVAVGVTICCGVMWLVTGGD